MSNRTTHSGYDAISLIMVMERVTFPEAFNRLAVRLGIKAWCA